MSDRYRADRFDGDGEPAKFYVFDTHDAGQECAGPFNTIEEAIAEQERLNGYPHVIVTKNAHGQYLGAPLQRWKRGSGTHVDAVAPASLPPNQEKRQ